MKMINNFKDGAFNELFKGDENTTENLMAY